MQIVTRKIGDNINITCVDWGDDYKGCLTNSSNCNLKMVASYCI